MRVLIIALPRTGSTSLLKKYSEELNLDRFDEPYSKLPNRRYNLEDNSVVKSIVSQKSVNFYTEFSKNFNKVILLSRKNIKECIQSTAYMSYNLDKGYKHYQDYTWVETPNYRETEVYIQKCIDSLTTISRELELPITYYEDLFDPNSPERQRKSRKKLL